MLIAALTAFLLLHYGSHSSELTNQLDQTAARIKQDVADDARKKQALAIVANMKTIASASAKQREKSVDALNKLLAKRDVDAVIDRVRAFADLMQPAMKRLSPKASIRIELLSETPHLDTSVEHPLTHLVSDLVGELYLAAGKKKEKAWQNAAKTMEKLDVPKSRIEHLMKEKKPELVAELVKELQTKK